MTEQGYYTESLSGARLRKCYELAPARVKQALEAEIEFVLEHTASDAQVLELGCGYGRVLHPLALNSREVVGIDTSHSSLRLARESLSEFRNCHVSAMNAANLAFARHSFGMVICIQNGLSAFKVDQAQVVREAVRVLRTGGKALFSSYSERFWDERLEWFQIQSQNGLIGEIDTSATRTGVIVCKDGFRATTLRPGDLRTLARGAGRSSQIMEVDDSTLFCILSPS